MLLDLAVPRDVEPEAGSVPGVTLLDVDALRDPGTGDEDAVRPGPPDRAEEVRRFVVRRRGDELAADRAIRRRGGDVLKRSSIGRAGRLADLTPDERAAVEALARGIVAKLLHDPIVSLKERSEPGSGRTHATLLAELLGLDPSARRGVTTLRIATRRSALARAGRGGGRPALGQRVPREVVPMSTSGDEVRPRRTLRPG